MVDVPGVGDVTIAEGDIDILITDSESLCRKSKGGSGGDRLGTVEIVPSNPPRVRLEDAPLVGTPPTAVTVDAGPAPVLSKLSTGRQLWRYFGL